MQSAAEFFDSLLAHVAVYPVTLWNVLIAPARIFRSTPTSSSCPAGITFSLTLAIVYVGSSALTSTITDDMAPDLGKLGNGRTLLILSLIYFCGIVHAQRGALRIALGARTDLTLEAELRALSYALSVALAVSCALVLAGLALNVQGEAFYLVPSQLIYLWGLHNVLKHGFDLAPREALVAAAAAYIAFFLTVTAVTIVVTIFVA